MFKDLDEWQQLAIKDNLSEDPDVWAEKAVKYKVFPDITAALEAKAKHSADCLIGEFAKLNKLESTSKKDKVLEICRKKDYKNRVQKDDARKKDKKDEG